MAARINDRSSDVRFLHVANGSATTNLIRAAGIPGRLTIWADVLHDGPVPGDADDEELIRMRARHLAGPSEDADAVARGLHVWRETITDVDSYDELVLWYEHDLFDQLNLLQLLSWMKPRLPTSTMVSLIEIGSYPGRPAFKGLGELTPEELAPLFGARVTVADERFRLAAQAWTAFRSATPEALDALRRAETPAMPFLRAALTRFLEEYPWTRDGLSRSERRLLTIASEGPTDLPAAFSLMQRGETAYVITDGSFLGLVRDLSQCMPPLLSVSKALLESARIPDGSLRITDRGRAVLNGDLDRMAEYGIDRWLGGVHLTGESVVWRWDESEQRIVKQRT